MKQKLILTLATLSLATLHVAVEVKYRNFDDSIKYSGYIQTKQKSDKAYEIRNDINNLKSYALEKYSAMNYDDNAKSLTNILDQLA